MKRVKQLLALCLAGAMLFALAACGQQESPAPNSGSASSEATPAGEGGGVQEGAVGGKTLVVYYSATGNTEAVAGYIAQATGGDLFELEPTEPYTDADLDWTNENSRVVYEHDNPDARYVDLEADSVENWTEYDTVFIGYPIWWGIAAWPVDTFVEANDFTGKTVIPFCTSSSSGLGESGDLLEALAGEGEWLEGERFRSGASDTDVADWALSLDLTASIPAESSQTLVVYFSQPETDDPDNMTQEEANSTVVVDGEVLGNTQYMAYVIQEAVDANLFRIVPEDPYPLDHDTLVDQALEEQNSNARPAITDSVEKMEQYDTVFVGYPNWWGDMPMILYTFFEEYDLSGKTIIPFNTHGGSGFSGTIGAIRELEPEADVLDGLSISRNSIQDAEQEILAWVESLGF